MAQRSLFALAGPCLVLALVGCPTNPPAGDGGVRSDTPIAPPDSPPIDAPPPDGTSPDTGGGGRSCTVGPPGACDVILQNCPNDAAGNPQACYLALAMGATSPTTQCAPIMGTLPEGAACTGVGQMCTEGSHCSPDDECREYCCMGSAADCPLGQLCQPYGDGTTTFNVGVCTPTSSCEVIPQTGCEADQVCVPLPDTSRLCQSAGTEAIGAECGGTTGLDCLADSICVGGATGPRYCREWCRVAMGATGNPDCTGATDMCQAIGGVDPAFGVCFPPTP